jgi:hypothetical protein
MNDGSNSVPARPGDVDGGRTKGDVRRIAAFVRHLRKRWRMSNRFGLSSSRHRFTLWPANPAALMAFSESVGGKILSGGGTPVEVEIPGDEAADRFRALFRPNLICETVPPSQPGRVVRYRRYGGRSPLPHRPVLRIFSA